MRWITFLIFLCFYITSSAQTSSYLVSMNGIGDIKLGMKKTELERLLKQPIKLSRLALNDGYSPDTINCKYNGLDILIVFQKEEVNEQKEIIVWEVKSFSPELKTRSGIAIGDDKLKIISTYEGYTIHIMPEYEGPDYTIKSKTRSTVWLHGEESGKVIIFHLSNNKVTGMSVVYDEGC